MGPRPYSENSSLPNDVTRVESLPAVTTPNLAENLTPSTQSGAATLTSIPQEIIPVEQHMDTADFQDNLRGEESSPCYPTPGDIMPYDHSLPDFIRQITNQTNLANLQSLSLRIISTCISLHRMSAYLPNLKELDLEGSILNSLRDIGCSFKNLQILKVGRCQLESLDGTFGLSGLRELYAQKNLITDVSPCSNLPHIKHIDVSCNRIRNISYAGFLSVCSKLRSIIFAGNPATEVENYRKHVRRILPQLEALDGVPFSNEDTSEEAKESEAIEYVGNESDSSAEIPDFFSVSPSDSMNNLLDSEDDINLLEKKYKQAKNAANQDQFDLMFDHDAHDVSSGTSKKYDYEKDFKNLTLQKNKVEDFSEPSNATKIIDSKIVKQKCASIQKLDKDIENRSKKSNIFLKADHSEKFVSPPAIGTKSIDSSSSPESTFNLSAAKNKNSHWQDQTQTSEGVRGKFPEDFEKTEGNERVVKKESSTKANTDVLEKINYSAGISSLTSGTPIRGNLTAALRHRNKVQNNQNIEKSTFQNFMLKNNLTEVYSPGIGLLEDSLNYNCTLENDVDYLQELLSTTDKTTPL